MDIFGHSPAYRDESDGQVHFGLILSNGEEALFWPEEAIPAFLYQWGKPSIMVDIVVVEAIPASLLN